jgi:hypothetical protein
MRLGKLTVVLVVKKLVNFDGNRRFNKMFTTVRHCAMIKQFYSPTFFDFDWTSSEAIIIKETLHNLLKIFLKYLRPYKI